jgi:hypothetical protein
MNNRQTAQTNMFGKMALFFSKYQSVLTAFAPLWIIIKQFLQKTTELNTVLQQQQTDSKGQTKNKESLLQTMSDALLPLARKARVWAGQQADLVSEQLFDVTESDFSQATLETITLARNILAGLNANAAALVAFNITAQQLTDAGTAIENLAASIGTPGQMQNIAKAGTEGLVTIINDMSKLLHDSDDLLIPEFSTSEAAMVLEYYNNRRIGVAVNRHTTLTVHVYADAAKTQPIAGAVITLPKYSLTATTDLDGTGVIEQFKGGELSATVSAVGFADSTIPFTIKNGQHIDIDVVMVAAPAPIKQG